MRRFSSYGPIDTQEDYYAPREALIQKGYSRLVNESSDKGGHYITVWAPRQCGKTWILREVVGKIKLSGEFETAIITLERAKDVHEENDVMRILIDKLENAFEISLPDIRKIEDLPTVFVHRYFKKPVILVLDEFDSLEESFINRFAGIFRDMFMDRGNQADKKSHEKTCLLHGLALIGVRSVLGIENTKGSPFNVQQSLHIPNLDYEETVGMFKWYEKESGQTVHEEVVERLYSETRGQPGLTCWFGELMTDTFNKDKESPITIKKFEDILTEATQALPNNNILNIISKAKQEPYKTVVLELFKTDQKMEFRYDDPQLNFLYMNGVIDVERLTDQSEKLGIYCRFASQFVQSRLFNYFSREMFHDLGLLVHPLDDLKDAVTETELNIPNIVNRYKAYLQKNKEELFRDMPRRKTDKRLYEAVYHFNFFRYVYDLLSKRGISVIPQFPTGNGQIDLILKHAGRVYAVELKSFRDMYDYNKGIRQAEHYGRQLKLREIVLLVFVELKEEEVKELAKIVSQPDLDIDVIPVGVL